MDPRKQKTGAEKRKEQRKRALEQAGNDAKQMKLTFKSSTKMPIRYEKTQVEKDNDPDCHYIRIRIRMILFRKYKCRWCNTN